VPLLNYNRVRACLRDSQRLKVKLTEMPLKLSNENYPPIIKRKITDVLRNHFEPIPWHKFKDQDVLVWAPPVELPTGFDQQEGFAKHFAYISPEGRIPELPRASLYYTLDHFMNKRRTNVSNNVALFGNGAVNYSGEIEFPFKVKVLAVENIQILIDQAWNGLMHADGTPPPRNSTKDGEISEPIAPDKKNKTTVSMVPRLAKNMKALPAKSDQDERTLDNKFHIDQGTGASSVIVLNKAYEFVPFLPFMIAVEVLLYSGNQLLDTDSFQETPQAPFTIYPRWSEWIYFNELKLSSLPLETKLLFNVKMISQKGEHKIIGCSYLHLFDIFGKMKTNLIELNLWPFCKADPDLVCTEEFWGLSDTPNNRRNFLSMKSESFARLVIQLENFALPVFWSLRSIDLLKETGEYSEETKEEIAHDTSVFSRWRSQRNKNTATSETEIQLVDQNPTTEELAMLQTLIHQNVSKISFTDKEKEIIFKSRHHYKTLTKGLAIFLQSVNWSRPELASEAYHMLEEWTPLDPEEALELLDARFGNEAVRAYAVERLSEMHDDDLALYMPQLVQALAYESSHLSFLGDFLIERAIANPFVVGNQLYWQLRSSLNVKATHERYYLILEQFVMLVGSYRSELSNQVEVNERLTKIARNVKRLSNRTEISDYCRTYLGSLNNDIKGKEFSFPLDTRMRATEFIVEECSVKDFKNLPVWLSARTSGDDINRITTIFEVGHDLKQHLAITQLISFMDRICLENGLDMCMRPYKVMPSSESGGMIELLKNASSLTNIPISLNNPNFLKDYFDKYNSDPGSRDKAMRSFWASVAAYAIAAYVLGIEDRTFEDMMLQKNGYFSVINFKGFLGYNKGKQSTKKEFFTLILELAASTFDKQKDEARIKFTDLCVRGYNLIRKHGRFFVNLLSILVPSGLDNLTSQEDLQFLHERLALNMTPEDATTKFKAEIAPSLQGNTNIAKKIESFKNARKKGNG